MSTVTTPARTGSRIGRAGSRGPRTAFVLGGGASLGAMQVGMLRALAAASVAEPVAA